VACLSLMLWPHVGGATSYLPAVLQAGTMTKLCASLLEPNETLTMKVALIHKERNTALFEKTSSAEFHECIDFQTPLVQDSEVQMFEVVVQGNTFYSKEERKVMIKVYKPGTFDSLQNRIGQWRNKTSNGKILQLSYSLSSEARMGRYSIVVNIGGDQVFHNFKVEKYDKTGCDRFTFEMSKFITDGGNLLNSIDFHATVREDGTGKSIALSYVIGKLSFIDTAKFYVPGSTFEGKIKAVHYNNTPMANMELYLSEGRSWSLSETHNLTTDSNGVATFSLNTTTYSGNIRLHIRKTLGYPHHTMPFYESDSHSLSEYQPPSPNTKSVSSLEVKSDTTPLPCDSEQDIPIHYSLVGEPKGSVKIMYLVSSFFFITDILITPDLAPEFQLVVYAVLPSKHVIASSGDFSTEKCFSHTVSLEFLPSSAVPAEQTKLQLTAQPNSLCGLSAIDQSVLIKEPGKTLNADKIFDILPVKKASPVSHEVEDPLKCLIVRHKRYILPYPYPEENEAYKVFKNTGLKIATNLMIRLPSCVMFKGHFYTRVDYMMGSAQGGFSSPLPIQTARTFFPETWIWDLVEVGESGTKDVFLTAPDTITTWETETFCLSSQGFGLAPRKQLTVFQPFFLELTLPYSIIRGENFELKATVFNYLSSCIMVKVTPGPSSGYILTPVSSEEYASCLCGSERKTFRWNMNPTALGVVNITVTAEAIPSHASCDNEIVNVPERGRIDIVTKSLIVKAEGIEITKTYNWLHQTLILFNMSCAGDVIGRALRNIEGLLQMPYGCGEQNMALLAPNIYILHYLQNTQQLTPTIKEKAFNFLTSGYQRQLNYKDYQGAYSTFGTGPGNTWLTAFVVRSFFKAQSFVFIDPSVLERSTLWLVNKQKQNGCFEKSGKLFNNRMKGGVSDEVTLSAYITAAFLELETFKNVMVTRSLSCLKGSINELNNTYTTALLAYVFTLAGDMETRAHLLQHLDKEAVKKGESTETSDSLSVEIGAYVLMSLLSTSHTAEDLGYASSIVRWMTGQQNYYGGFSSTQDTVVALQALSLYATVVFTPEGSSTVTVQSPSAQLEFDVKPDNKLLYQEKVMNDVTGKYTLEVKGSACSSIQISQHYNIPPRPDITTLSVEVKAETNCSDASRHKLTLHLKYSGVEKTTNMIILDIKVLSGFVPDEDSLQSLKHATLVDRVEQNQDHIVIYLRELKQGEAVSHILKLVQQLPVENLKPALVKIYDYYQPSDQAETQYISNCA
uniref:Alpha-2-macroglobulin bait region domain-containing protein n=1 Tax=Oryzias melastigma TaxID=30732 RepID=A0A3B3CQX5_ORYME